jgi:hypothetical protein
MKQKIGLNKVAIMVGCILACLSGSTYAGAISINSTSFTNTIGFDSLGTGTVTWNDGTTINGVYAKAYTATFGDGTGVPTNASASTGSDTIGGMYNLGLSGGTDRALGWKNTSATSGGTIGIQFQNNSGATNLTVSYNFLLEQWSSSATAAQNIVLQYKITATGGNILTASSWIALGTNLSPNITNTGEINGNLTENQMTISGTTNLVIGAGQYLTFRTYDVDHSGGDHMFAIESATVSVVPEPTTLGLFFTSCLGILVLRRMRL